MLARSEGGERERGTHTHTHIHTDMLAAACLLGAWPHDLDTADASWQRWVRAFTGTRGCTICIGTKLREFLVEHLLRNLPSDGDRLRSCWPRLGAPCSEATRQHKFSTRWTVVWLHYFMGHSPQQHTCEEILPTYRFVVLGSSPAVMLAPCHVDPL